MRSIPAIRYADTHARAVAHKPFAEVFAALAEAFDAGADSALNAVGTTPEILTLAQESTGAERAPQEP